MGVKVGIVASRHRVELEDYLNFSEVNEDHFNTMVSKTYVDSLDVEFKGVINADNQFYATNRDFLNGFAFVIDNTGAASILIYGKGTINLGTVVLNDGFRKFKFSLTGAGFPLTAELYIDDVLTLNGSLFSSFVNSTADFYLNTLINDIGTPTNFYNGKIVWLRINGTTFPFGEGSGFASESDQGDVGTGVTSNPLQLTYWNDSVWKKKKVGDDAPPVEPNYDGDIYLLIGQSNMDGAALVADASPQYKGVIAGSKIWNDQFSQWDDLEAGVNGSAGLAYGLIFSLAYELNQQDPAKTNYFVMKSLGGTGLYDDWGVGLPFYNAALNSFANANQTGLYNKKAILWQQGEEDSKLVANSGTFYENRESAMIDGMKISSGIPAFISGELGDINTAVYVNFASVNTAKNNNVTAGFAAATINTLDLALQVDGVHFTAAAYEVLGGVRYFDLVKNL
jgi:hypothetical protein